MFVRGAFCHRCSTTWKRPSGRALTEARYSIVRVQLQRAGLITFLLVLSMFLGLSLFTTQMTHASSPPRHTPAKDTNPILPKKLRSQSGVPANTVSIYESTTTATDRKSTRLNSSHVRISYAVFCLKKKKKDADWK